MQVPFIGTLVVLGIFFFSVGMATNYVVLCRHYPGQGHEWKRRYWLLMVLGMGLLSVACLVVVLLAEQRLAGV